MKKEIKDKKLINQYYYFKAIFTVINILTNSFYYILLFKNISDLSAIFIDGMIFFIAQYVGYVISTIFIGKIGYVNGYKISNFINFAGLLVIGLNLDKILVLYPIFAFLRGFPRGIFWAINNTHLLKETSENTRKTLLSNILSLDLLFEVLIPILIGSIVTIENDYSIIYLMASMISLISVFRRWDYNKKPRNKITISEVSNLLSNGKFRKFLVLMMISLGIDSLLSVTLLLVPFLILESEFEVGLLVGIMNLIAALFIFIQRKKSYEAVLKTSTIGVILLNSSRIIFAVAWNFPLLISSNIAGKIGISLYKPLESKMDINIREAILGKDLNSSNIEMNFILESVFTIGRVTVLLIFSLILTNTKDLKLVLQVILIVSSIWNIIFFYQLFYLHKSFRAKHRELKEKEMAPTINIDATPNISHQ